MPRAFLSMMLVVGWLLGAGVAAQAQPAAGGSTPVSGRLGVLTDNYPFSYRSAGGAIEGFAVDLTAELERTMGLHFQRVEGPTGTIHRGFAEGKVDLLQSMAQFPEREDYAAFSFPYLTVTGAIFVREGETAIRSFADLRGRKVLVHPGSLGETVLRRAGMERSIVHIESVEQALLALDRGEGEATLVTRLSGLLLAQHVGATRVRPLDVAVPGYEVRYCYAVKEGDRVLLAQINEGLAILQRTGGFDAIYRRWFGRVEPVRYSMLQVMMAVAVGLALALLVAMWAVVRQRRLRRQIQLQAEALRASEERHRGIFEGASNGLVVLRPVADAPDQFVIEQINPAAGVLLGREPAHAAGLALTEAIAADPQLLALLTHAASRRETIEAIHARPALSEWWRVVVGPIGARTVVAITDVSAATLAQQRLRHQEEQMQHTQKLEAIGTLAGGVAHDFNNLLTAIIGNAELGLLTVGQNRPESESFEQVLHASRRARQLVKQILAFSRRAEPRQEVLAVAPVLHEAIEFLRTAARGAVEFEYATVSDTPPIRADAVQLHQVLMNIGTNAVQAMRGTNGRLTIREERLTVTAEIASQHPGLKPGSYVRISLQDTGPGMPPAVLARIFEPFYTTKAPGEGTGLGLSVVHGIMQQHGGAVTVYSQVGRGTLFHLYFPTADAAAAACVSDDLSAVPLGRGELVLFVDDDPAILKTAKELLLRMGYRVKTQSRADDAAMEFAARPAEFAVVLTDLTMPGGTGLLLAARVRAMRPEVPIVLASGFFTPQEELDSEALKIDRRLHKPLTYATLGHALAEVLATRA